MEGVSTKIPSSATLTNSHYPYTSPHPTAGRDGQTFFKKGIRTYE